MAAHSFGTIGTMMHDDFVPDMPKGTKVVVLREHPGGVWEYEVAYVNPSTGEAAIGAINEDDFLEESR